MTCGSGPVVMTIQTMRDYPPGFVGVISALFGRHLALSSGTDWTFDLMIAEQQCEFFRRFDPSLDRVWVAMDQQMARGGITIDGPRPEAGREFARLRFFILDESLRGLGLGRTMIAQAMQFCRNQKYDRVQLTTMQGLDSAARLYRDYGFSLVKESAELCYGSRYTEQTFELRMES